MKEYELRFLASLSVCPSDIRKIKTLIQATEQERDPLENLLFTPLFSSPYSLEIMKELSEQGKRIIFDSGGYYVQIGRLTYNQLYLPLLRIYRENTWADLYTLPDHVPTSQDSAEVVDMKVRDTVVNSTLFFQEMPDVIKPKAMPVVQGNSMKQMDLCLKAYIKLGVRWIGFGSFGTVGKNFESNVATQKTVDLARYVIDVAHSNNIKVHLFGLGVPALVAMLKGVKADSFDSSSWLKAAGFGQVFLPFLRAYNISHNIVTDTNFQRGITLDQFNQYKELTGHDCLFCRDFKNLQANKMHRATHNLIVIHETVSMANSGNYEQIRRIYLAGSPKYRGEFEKWLQ